MYKFACTALLIVGLFTSGIHSVLAAQSESVGASGFNLKNADFEPSELNRDNFYHTLLPLAKAEGSVSLYNFAASYPPFWKEVVIPAFTAKYGIKVNFFSVKPDAANQQLLAVQQAGRNSPVDIYFADGQSTPALLYPAGIIANLPLSEILPEARNYDLAHSGVWDEDHRGSVMPFHGNQSAIGYNSAVLSAGEVPANYDALLAYAQAHPGKVAITSPLKGGSGSGFLISVASRFMNEECGKTFSNAGISRDDAQVWVHDSRCLDTTWDYFRNLMKVSELTNGNADTVNLLANNQVNIGTVIEDNAFNAVKQNRLPDTFRQTVMAPAEVGRSDVIFVVAGATHPAAALLLIDFSLTREMQVWKLQHLASRSSRKDIDADNIVTAEDAKFLVPSPEIKSYRTTWPSSAISDAIINAFEEQVLARL